MMKKLLVALAMFPMVATAADAVHEIAPSTFELTGNTGLGFLSESSKDKGAPESEKTTSYGIDAKGLYYVVKDLGVGLNLTYGSSNTKLGDTERGGSSLRIGPAVGYELGVGPQLAVFGVADVGYVSNTVTSKTAGVSAPDFTQSGYGFGIEAGVKYFLVKNFSFNAALGYDWEKVKDDKANALGEKGENTTSGFGLNVGLSVYFGG